MRSVLRGTGEDDAQNSGKIGHDRNKKTLRRKCSINILNSEWVKSYASDDTSL